MKELERITKTPQLIPGSFKQSPTVKMMAKSCLRHDTYHWFMVSPIQPLPETDSESTRVDIYLLRVQTRRDCSLKSQKLEMNGLHLSQRSWFKSS